MKFLLTLMALSISTNILAMPYRCTSHEIKNGAPVAVFKINPMVDGKYILGVTPQEKARVVLRGQGNVSDAGMGLNFVDDGFLMGYFTADPIGQEIGILEGKISHSSVSSQVLTLTCLNLEIFPEN